MRIESTARAAALIAVLLAAVAASMSSGCLRQQPARPADVVLVTIDTLRADHLGAYGDARAATPVLDDLAARGVRFIDVVAPAPLTLPSHASILSGRTPLAHGVHDNGHMLPPSVPSMAERFSAEGYETAAFVSGFPLQRQFGLNRGFRVYDDRFTRGDHGRSELVERPANETISAVLAWLEQIRTDARSPVFLWIHLFDPHAPYEPPEPFRSRFRGQSYDGEIAFVDAQLGLLLQGLKRIRPDHQALIAVTADHGEGLGDHREPTHGLFIYDSTLRVPLIIAGPGVPAGQAVEAGASLIDLAPTLLDIAGLAPLAAAEGSSLRQLWTRRESGAARPRYAESQFGRLCCGWAPLEGWRDGRWMFIDAPRVELYDLESDPTEAQNVASQYPAEAARLRRALNESRKPAGQIPTDDASSDARARLRSLGYLDRSAVSKPSLRDPKDMIDVSTQLGLAIESEATDPERTVVILEDVLRADPDNPTARRHLATALIARHQLEAAEKVLDALERDGDVSVETSAVLADLAIARGDFRDARHRLERIYSDKAGDLAIAFKLALVLARTGAADKAIPLLEAVIHGEPENTDALVDLGGALLQSGRARDAITHFQRATERDSQLLLAWNGLGFARLLSGDRTGAVEAFQRSLRLDSNQPEITEALRKATP